MVGRLYHLGRRRSRERARELLGRFDLAEAGGRPVKTYSGGMRRRLDLAAAMVASPDVLFLDEPTTGLDPRSRLAMWELVDEVVGEGATVLLTTQYLDEADRLARTIAVIDHGRVIAAGTPDELKDRVGGERLEVRLGEGSDGSRAADALGELAAEGQAVDVHERTVSVPIAGRAGAIAAAVRLLDGVGAEIEDVTIRRPTLDDVFLTLTGRPPEESGEDAAGEVAA
jgi:ABC-2 type transport system ATP-binding protein